MSKTQTTQAIASAGELSRAETLENAFDLR
jgi:hypothetical protein